MKHQLVSINIAAPRTVEIGGRVRETGIYKTPVRGPVRVAKHGVEGDSIIDTKNHGGVDQAVYVYGTSDYAWWSKVLGRDLAPGTFGDNLTISELVSTNANVGDELTIGDVILQVTAPRIPCSTLAHRMEDATFVKRFRHAERPGLYCRVLREGVVRTGDEVRLERYAEPTVGVLKMFRDHFESRLDEPALREYLAAPIAIRDRVKKQQQLAAGAST